MGRFNGIFGRHQMCRRRLYRLTYLVDVLQRVSIHPAHRVAELTPRLWKEHFADNPLRSDIYDSG